MQLCNARTITHSTEMHQDKSIVRVIDHKKKKMRLTSKHATQVQLLMQKI